ncbi:hypothetical protein [Sediminibacterium ginsengisoli]|uniref:Tetratricopeptide repeat-containing protein n=1 Tax=Sediminibacterium ginsengisoli TaxID=413434 RepID=A0A1T4M776_9BACT|nr:hypothetical protein [Sediminibacterium ginsengisoli]SJZ62870.1 hypothetical protein SAMN04488132_103224 [Sediminibacterium ginsengisoli]
MKKLFVILLLAIVARSGAQTNALEAKAAYLLAEEHYGKGDMQTALQYLDEAAAKLGSANAKILFLRINVLKELNTKSGSYAVKLDSAIAQFERAPDMSAFNEEKLLEVMKIKLERNRLKNRGSAAEKGIKAFQEENRWYPGMHVDSVVALNKAFFDEHFKKNPSKKGKLSPDGAEIIYDDASLKSYRLIVTKDNRLKTYMHMLFYESDQSDFSKAKQKSQPVLSQYGDLFGYLPEPEILDQSNTGAKIITNLYKWKWQDLKFAVGVQYVTVPPATYTSGCYILLTNDPEFK